MELSLLRASLLFKTTKNSYLEVSGSIFWCLVTIVEFVALSENDKDMWCKNIELNMNNDTYIGRLRSSGSFYEDKIPILDEQCASIPYTSNTPTNPVAETVY